MTISVGIISCNDADSISQLIAHYRPHVDEVIIGDDYSTDGTWEIAQEQCDGAYRLD